ncbi:hypothetical protein K440DRAFT_623933 [Wilcoxina mikolae CBS 423.85]|nr:hypothetical protein K440DRAFT_623933 [Wilcoxina mikolae CBS 423.85]
MLRPTRVRIPAESFFLLLLLLPEARPSWYGIIRSMDGLTNVATYTCSTMAMHLPPPPRLEILHTTQYWMLLSISEELVAMDCTPMVGCAKHNPEWFSTPRWSAVEGGHSNG